MTELDPRQVTYMRLEELEADPRNPKAHDEETIDKSIGRFGMLDPIVQDQRTGYIVSGHGRHKALMAMQERGETAPEGVKTTSTGEWLVPVVTGWASRTDSESAAALEGFDLSGAVLYSSCQPCPMCLTAALWARVETIVFGATQEDAAAAGFDDSTFYDQLRNGLYSVTDAHIVERDHRRAVEPFEAWAANEKRVEY